MNKRLYGMAGNIKAGYRDLRTQQMKARHVRRQRPRERKVDEDG